MSAPTVRQARLFSAIYIAILLLAAGNHYLGWGLTGGADRRVLAIVVFVGVMMMTKFGSRVVRQMENHRAAQKQTEDAAEGLRDKANDEAEAERLRRDMGMPPGDSPQRSRDR